MTEKKPKNVTSEILDRIRNYQWETDKRGVIKAGLVGPYVKLVQTLDELLSQGCVLPSDWRWTTDDRVNVPWFHE